MYQENEVIFNKITLRQLLIQDFEAVLLWSKDSAFCTANGWPLHRNPDELYQWWIKCVNHHTDDFIRLGIEFDGQFVGYADLANIINETAELGIAVGNRDLWGKGIGTLAAIKMIEYGSNILGITTYTAETHEENVRARRLLEKIGFKEIRLNSPLIQYMLEV